jgi:adenylate cyclase
VAAAREGRRVSAILVAGRAPAGTAEGTDPTISRGHGRTIKTDGSTFVAEFSSVVDAVNCAIELRQRMSPDLRVGIDLGEVIEGEGGPGGEGVAIASRMMAAAAAGGIVLSGAAHAPAHTAVPHAFDPLGEVEVEGPARRVPAFNLRVVDAKAAAAPNRKARIAATAAAVLLAVAAGAYAYLERPWEAREARASVARMAYPLPERPSIGVMPFTNVSGDAAHDVLADGLSENVAAALSRTSAVFIVARESTFAYKGKPVEVRQVAEDLGIRYVLRGSFRRDADRLNVKAELIDALSGRYIWQETYDRTLRAFFDIGDDIALGASEGMEAKLTLKQRDLMLRRDTSNLEAWLLYREAQPLMRTQKLEDLQAARRALARAIELDGDFVSAIVSLAAAFANEGRSFLRGNSRDMFARAEELLDRAGVTDANRAETWAQWAHYRIQRGDIEGGVQPAERALGLDPNNWANQELLGLALHRLNRHADAIRPLRAAWRLYPSISNATVSALGRAHMFANQPQQAIATFEAAIKRNPDPAELAALHAWLAVIHFERADEPKAREHLKLALAARPDLTIGYFRRTYLYKDATSTVFRWMTSWRRLGLPD